jgi:hypothetical protein
MATKTLNVNSEYFSLGSKKQTKKNRSSTPKMDLKPIISTNSLKHKLLNRIKEHKNKEIKSLDKEVKDIKENKGVKTSSSTSNVNSDITNSARDEFEESLNYLKELSESRKKNMSDKTTRGGTGNNITRKNINDTYTSSSSTEAPFVELDLPDSLKEPVVKTPTPIIEQKKLSFQPQPQIVVSSPSSNTTSVSISNIKPNYNVDTQVPYGVLKGGIKPTFRQWNKTMKVNRPLVPTTSYNPPQLEKDAPISSTPTSSTPTSSTPTMKSSFNTSQHLKYNSVSTSTPVTMVPKINYTTSHVSSSTTKTEETKEEQKEVPILKTNTPQPVQEPSIKKTKRTIKSKYTLGKSKKNNTVSVLLKNKNTRKNILNAQKELKKKSISDIKKYLLSHNLIKIGSTAPNDVLRKIYESSMLSGEIVNHNDETLLHNLMKETEEKND